MRAYFRRCFAYDAWANRETLAACERASDTLPPIALKRLAHIAAAHALWQSRLRGQVSPVPVWPAWSLAETTAWLERAAEAWPALVGAFDPDALIRYTNSKGEPFESRAEDVLTHALMHAAYHRGQMAADLRAAGCEPAYTDFIHATRSGIAE